MSDSSFAHGLIGTTLDGRYRLDAVLGEGGMGAVFRASHVALERKVAIKLLKPHLSADPKALERFSREARSTLRVDSPHAVKLLDFGITPRQDYYIVLEYLDGRTVQRELEIDGPFAPARVAHIARQALHALGAAHATGLIHRDVKPDNLLLMRSGGDGDYTKVLDFGVAKLMQGAADPALLALTADGVVFGTPEFMSPEQACGQPLDGRSDLYSLAVTLFVMLTGTTLFEADTPIAWLTHHVRTPPPSLAAVRPELAAFPELDALLQRCLAKQRDARPASAAELAALFREIEQGIERGIAQGIGPEIDDKIEPARAPGPRSAGTPALSRASSYVQVLRDSQPDVQATAPTIAVLRDRHPDVRATAPTLMQAMPARFAAPAPAGTPARPLQVRRWRMLWVAGGAMIALAGIVIGLAIHRAPSRSTSISGPPGSPSLQPRTRDLAAVVPATVVGSPTTKPADPIADPASGRSATEVGDPARPSDATSATAPTPTTTAIPGRPVPAAAAGKAHVSRPTAPHSVDRAARAVSVVDEHLRNAEEALQRDNPLRQLAEADLALHADPHSVRARFLLGDALIKSGDLDHGCKYLQAIAQLAAARDRARTAGCAGN